MKTKFNLLKTKKQMIASLSAIMVTMIMIFTSCSKDTDMTTVTNDNNNLNRSAMPLAFISKTGSSNQTFSISCTCAGGFTLTSTLPHLYYGTTTPTTIPLYNSGYSVTLQKYQYYYFIPNGGSYGNNTKCLKIMYLTGLNKPQVTYNATTNTWSGLITNSDVEATQVNKSTVPECIPC